MFCCYTVIDNVHSLRYVKHRATSFVPGLKEIGLKLLCSSVANCTDHMKKKLFTLTFIGPVTS